MRRHLMLGLAACSAACFTPPNTRIAPRAAMEVNASFARTWDAVIDLFAARNIPIRTMDRSSGLIVSEELSVGREGTAWADCGRAMGTPLPPDRAVYNIVVRGDSAHATVRVTARWTQGGHPGDPLLIECVSTGRWEGEVEAAIKAAAEVAPPVR